jgi:hypothetical protein
VAKGTSEGERDFARVSQPASSYRLEVGMATKVNASSKLAACVSVIFGW